jgi:tellurite resistance protein
MTTETPNASHKELTAHFRNRLKAAGIKARCKMLTYCGERVIRIGVPTSDGRFTDDEQRVIRTIAQVNGLTLVQGMAIDVERMTDTQEATFYMGYAR